MWRYSQRLRGIASFEDYLARRFWDRYMEACEDAIRATASAHAPWFVVPADNKWFTRRVLAAAVVDALERLDSTYPKVDDAKLKALAAARKALATERE